MNEDENDAQRVQEEQARQLLQIQDEESYIRSNAIENPQPNENNNVYNQEERERLRREQSYQQEILQRLVEEDKSEEKNDESFKKREKILASYRGINLSINTRDEVLENVPLYGLAKTCEVVYALASSKHWLSASSRDTSLVFTLDHFSASDAREFLLLVEDPKKVQDLTSDNIITCCRIAHFLQCTFSDDIVEIIRQSIDPDNCAAICNLADELNDTSLFLSSLPFVMKSLEEIKNDEAWDDFSPSLQNHVMTARNAFESRIASGGKNSQALYTSSNEFLALLSDHLFELKERFREAVERQNEVIEERRERNRSRRFIRNEEVMNGSVRDTAVKIEKQELRIKTLEQFYRQQKSIFAKDATTEGRYKRPFIL